MRMSDIPVIVGQGIVVVGKGLDAFSTYAIREDLTPTLYRLTHSGFVFDNISRSEAGQALGFSMGNILSPHSSSESSPSLLALKS